jgi:hypothetical protein
MLTDAQLDTLLTLQLATAWAGERSGDEPRLGWWAKLGTLLARWDREGFAVWARRGPGSNTANEPSGRRLTSAMPDDPVEVARRMVHALVPFTDIYPCPHVRHAYQDAK